MYICMHACVYVCMYEYVFITKKKFEEGFLLPSLPPLGLQIAWNFSTGEYWTISEL